MKRNSQSGVALVITLIMLSVITFMAVTFLVVSRHEGAQVNTLTQQANAKFAADAAAQQAMGTIAAQMLANNNGLNFGMLVSTNFISAVNFAPNNTSLTNVTYNGLLKPISLQQMLNNLLILPRAPVFIVSNKNQSTPPEFRYWLDLNRNGVYDTNGLVFEVDENGVLTSHVYVGDPEWIGILNHPEMRHSPSNFFVGRYCFIALPIGNSLDINYIHSQSKLLADPWDNGFLRNQGVGSWELNLAAFLHELNTNWDNGIGGISSFPYQYQTNSTIPSQGRTFEFATAITQYRFNNNYPLRSFFNLYCSNNAASAPAQFFKNDGFDGYSHGPLMTGLTPLPSDPDVNLLKFRWSGDYSSNQYFTTQDLFNSVPTVKNQTDALSVSSSFSNQLYAVGRTYSSLINSTTGSITNSYNRYTFYRMLSQMSFGSAPEPASYPYAASANANYTSAYANAPRLNLNYVNVGGVSATNFVPWTPAQFFTNAADRMLRAYFPNPIGTNNGRLIYLSITNIPIYPTNYYTPAIHRVLQLAANIYDSSTNKANSGTGFDYPSVFRPIFVRDAKLTNIYISGYQEVSNNIDFTAPKDLRRAIDFGKFPVGTPVAVNVYGVPYVIGAKQGLPAFNKFISSPVIEMWRKLEVTKPLGSTKQSEWHTNAQYTINISNVCGVECWYPSTNVYYPRQVAIYVTNDMTWQLTNDIGIPSSPVGLVLGAARIFPTNAPFTWSGSINLARGPGSVATTSFKQPMTAVAVVQPNASLRFNPLGLVTNASTLPMEVTPGYFIPKWGLSITNRLRMMMVDEPNPSDATTWRLVDYVELGGLGELNGVDTYDDINAELAQYDGRFWSTNAYNPPNSTAPTGFFNQVSLAEGGFGTDGNVWLSVHPPSPINSRQGAIDKFKAFILDKNQTSAQVPFVVAAKFQSVHMLSVNDPLVHYMASDLIDLTKSGTPTLNPVSFDSTNVLASTYGQLTTNRYQPWLLTSSEVNLKPVTTNEIAYKDPMVRYSDSFQFTSNKFPNIGWLGRVHRGTPWQTVNLKSTSVDSNGWINWTGDALVNYHGINDPQASQPANDWLLMDLFTTSPNDNASKGQLSINQTNLAAWAAVFDGMIVVKNTNGISATNVTPWVIEPTNTFNGTNMVQYLVNRINATRAAYPSNVFTSLGQICSVPELTVNSPFLNTNIASSLSDAAYERIPQQIMSLLRVGSPRYVIFAYGQSLKPADRSIVQSGQYFGMCTNYQITGEVATRMVVRFDNFPIPIPGLPTPPTQGRGGKFQRAGTGIGMMSAHSHYEMSWKNP